MGPSQQDATMLQDRAPVFGSAIIRGIGEYSNVAFYITAASEEATCIASPKAT